MPLPKIRRLAFEEGPSVDDPEFTGDFDGVHLSGGRVYNPDGEYVGTVEEVFGNAEHSRISDTVTRVIHTAPDAITQGRSRYSILKQDP
jgi:hypothetical protein